MAEQCHCHVTAGNNGGEDAGELADDLKPAVRHREAESESSHYPGGIDLGSGSRSVDHPEPGRREGSMHQGRTTGEWWSTNIQEEKAMLGRGGTTRVDTPGAGVGEGEGPVASGEDRGHRGEVDGAAGCRPAQGGRGRESSPTEEGAGRRREMR
jgi:hypothetical protein